MTTTVDPMLTRKDLATALLAADPAWLATLRREALARHGALTLPTGREEAWRYTDVSLLGDAQFPPCTLSVAGVPAAAAARWSSLRQGAAGAALLVDGLEAEVTLDPALARQGVVLRPLAEAAREHPALLEPYLGRLVGADDVFTAHALALHRGGLLLHVPPGVDAGRVHLLQWLTAAGTGVDTRLVVVLGQGASLTLEEHLASDPLATPTRAQPVAEVFVGPDARLTYAQWQGWGPGVRHLGHLKVQVEAAGRLTSFLGGFGADFARTQHGVVLAGPGAEADLLGAYFPGEGQHHEYWTSQEHRAEHTRSDLLYKGALGGDGRSVYYGTIRVGPRARHTDAYQANRNLLLDRRAHADTNPQLEIETNDVRCTHGATVGQVDAAQLFYLMSRGIPRTEAERLLVAGFFGDVLGRLKLDGAEARLDAIVEAKLAEVDRGPADAARSKEAS